MTFFVVTMGKCQLFFMWKGASLGLLGPLGPQILLQDFTKDPKKDFTYDLTKGFLLRGLLRILIIIFYIKEFTNVLPRFLLHRPAPQMRHEYPQVCQFRITLELGPPPHPLPSHSTFFIIIITYKSPRKSLRCTKMPLQPQILRFLQPPTSRYLHEPTEAMGFIRSFFHYYYANHPVGERKILRCTKAAPSDFK